MKKSTHCLTKITCFVLCYLFGMINLFPSLNAAENNTNTSNTFREYRATYQLYWQGMNVGSSEHQLLQLGPNLYSAESISKPFLSVFPFSNHERSQFVVDNNRLKPQRYDFKTEEKGRKIVGLVEFDWENNILHKSIFQGAEKEEPIPENALDRITYTLQLRQDLKQNKGPFTYTVVEPRKIKQYTFNVIGEEKINTPMGDFKTLKVEHVSDNGERRTQLWLAQDFDYLLIRLTQIRQGKVQSEVLLKNLQVIKPREMSTSKVRSRPKGDLLENNMDRQ